MFASGALKAIQHVLEHSDAIGKALGRPMRRNSSKHFVTAFSSRDFLTTHTDNANGAAFVLNLTPRWNPDHGATSTSGRQPRGGPLAQKRAFALRARPCPDANEPDYAVEPTFNSLTLFVVEQGGPLMPREVGRVHHQATGSSRGSPWLGAARRAQSSHGIATLWPARH